jgi:regulator of replication initiation timing
MNYNGSSLQQFKFDGWSQDKIIDKYETVLTSREKQITDLAMEIGVINERITTLSEQNSDLKSEVEMLKNRLQKRVSNINLGQFVKSRTIQ